MTDAKKAEKTAAQEMDDLVDAFDDDDDMFDELGSATFMEWGKYAGCRMLLVVGEFLEHIPTVHTKPGEKSPAVRADVIILDGDDAGTLYEECLVFPKVLVSQLKKKEGKKLIVKLVQGENKKQGQSPAWMFENQTDEESRNLAKAWLKSQREGKPNPFLATN